jgi:hypothetical protein
MPTSRPSDETGPAACSTNTPGPHRGNRITGTHTPVTLPTAPSLAPRDAWRQPPAYGMTALLERRKPGDEGIVARTGSIDRLLRLPRQRSSGALSVRAAERRRGTRVAAGHGVRTDKSPGGHSLPADRTALQRRAGAFPDGGPRQPVMDQPADPGQTNRHRQHRPDPSTADHTMARERTQARHSVDRGIDTGRPVLEGRRERDRTAPVPDGGAASGAALRQTGSDRTPTGPRPAPLPQVLIRQRVRSGKSAIGSELGWRVRRAKSWWAGHHQGASTPMVDTGRPCGGRHR